MPVSYVYIETSFGDIPSVDVAPKPLQKLENSKIIPIPLEKFFDIMIDVENYPQIIPSYVVDVKIVEKNPNYLIAEETFHFNGIYSTLLVKHTFFPYEKHVIEVLDGDAKDTVVIQIFSKNGNKTIIGNEIDLKLHGILYPFQFLPKQNALHALNTIVDEFVVYGRDLSSHEKIVDDLYREILLRPADQAGLLHYSSLLESGELTIDELKLLLQNSDEAKSILHPNDRKSISELNSATVEKIHSLYEEQLHRQADEIGLIFYGSLLESEKISVEEIRSQLWHSEEGTNIRLNSELNRPIDEAFRELFGRHATDDELDLYNELFSNQTMTKEKLHELILKNTLLDD